MDKKKRRRMDSRGWKSSDNEVSGERACASPETKHDRKASRKAVPRPPLLPTDLSELYDSVVVATERSRLSPGSLRRLGLGAEPPPPPLLPIISVSPDQKPSEKGRRKEKGTLMVWKRERRRRRKGRGLGAFYGCRARIKVGWFGTPGGGRRPAHMRAYLFRCMRPPTLLLSWTISTGSHLKQWHGL
uniref:Uncharacterized protein n=1 Tax=Oryza meridionalis TaxID=40149 RepID=A0A0E0E7E7_9ORYZ